MKAIATTYSTPSSVAGQRPSLTPELSAAVAARHSRTPDGLDAILEKVKGLGDEEAVDAVFKFADYGHRSILDMVPVSIHLEGVSLFLASMIWHLVKVGGGQEQSTRYNEMAKEGDFLGGGDSFTDKCVDAYQKAKTIWEEVATGEKAKTLLSANQDLSEAKMKRFQKNFVFDRSRGFMPLSALTNMNITTWGTEWTRLCALLEAAPWEEFKEAAGKIRGELSLVAPRLVKHSTPKVSHEEFWRDLVTGWKDASEYYGEYQADEEPAAVVFNTMEFSPIVTQLNRSNRYCPFDSVRRMTSVTYGWVGISYAELRDVNRHRPGERLLNLCPIGFYGAQDQFQEFEVEVSQYRPLIDFGNSICEAAFIALKSGDINFVYRLPLGVTCSFGHSNTLGNLLYEIELRTGPGTHYRYRQHYLDLLNQVRKQIPSLGKVLVGSGEPE